VPSIAGHVSIRAVSETETSELRHLIVRIEAAAWYRRWQVRLRIAPTQRADLGATRCFADNKHVNHRRISSGNVEGAGHVESRSALHVHGNSLPRDGGADARVVDLETRKPATAPAIPPGMDIANPPIRASNGVN
jgi:hypothetical protein